MDNRYFNFLLRSTLLSFLILQGFKFLSTSESHEHKWWISVSLVRSKVPLLNSAGNHGNAKLRCQWTMRRRKKQKDSNAEEKICDCCNAVSTTLSSASSLHYTAAIYSYWGSEPKTTEDGVLVFRCVPWSGCCGGWLLLEILFRGPPAAEFNFLVCIPPYGPLSQYEKR